MPLLRSLQVAVLGWASERKRLGRAEFQDLLVWTRDLLRDNLDVRDYYRDRYTHLLIDEAQDTDPLQAEIAMFLIEKGPEEDDGVGLVFFDDDEEEGDQDEDGDEGEFLG